MSLDSGADTAAITITTPDGTAELTAANTGSATADGPLTTSETASDAAGSAPAPAAAPAPAPAPPAGKQPVIQKPGLKIDPSMLTVIDTTGTSLQVPKVTCSLGTVKANFTASDPSGVSTLKATLRSGANGNPSSIGANNLRS